MNVLGSSPRGPASGKVAKWLYGTRLESERTRKSSVSSNLTLSAIFFKGGIVEFRSFTDIERIYSQVTITEKLHGSNAQILIYEEDGKIKIQAGCRTRFIDSEDDNFGFAKWVERNKDNLIAALGIGRHFGEWYGSGINSGYNLKEKRLALFNVHKYKDIKLPEGVDLVPVLYEGPWTDTILKETMDKLKLEGSKMQPGFMKPEGVVIFFHRNNILMKAVFESEDTGWKGVRKEDRDPKPEPVSDEVVNQYLQPIRLEKLLSKDEKYLREYPSSLPSIVRAYVLDLEKECNFESVEEIVQKTVKRKVFPWVKIMLKEKGYTA